MKILYHHRIRSKDGQYVHVEEMIGALKILGHIEINEMIDSSTSHANLALPTFHSTMDEYA